MKTGDLVTYNDTLKQVALHPSGEVKVRSVRRGDGRLESTSVSAKTLFMVLGRLTREDVLLAAYTGVTQADVDVCPPPELHECWLWCMGTEGVFAIPVRSLKAADEGASDPLRG